MCSVYEHNKNILTSSIFNDATIFHDIAKKKKKKKKKQGLDISFFLVNLGVMLTKEV